MKKLIVILLMFSFIWVNAQVKRTLQTSESFALKKDKVYHIIAGATISTTFFLFINNTYAGYKDPHLAFRAAWMASAFAALGKEMIDGTMRKEVSLADMTYTIGSGLITSGLLYGITKRKRKRKANKIRKKFDISFLPNLKNEPLIRN